PLGDRPGNGDRDPQPLGATGPAHGVLREPAPVIALGSAQSGGGHAALAPAADPRQSDPSLRHHRALLHAQGRRDCHPVAERPGPAPVHAGPRVAERLAIPQTAELGSVLVGSGWGEESSLTRQRPMARSSTTSAGNPSALAPCGKPREKTCPVWAT